MGGEGGVAGPGAYIQYIYNYIYLLYMYIYIRIIDSCLCLIKHPF